jgi:hypothetical protein|tara:strand:+ start:1596 stop:2045 length:450 start_codon:yes stop_codon:yes gene_type:complete
MKQFDEIIDCPKSGGDLCYKIEVNKDITNYMSLSCGFWTNSLMKEGTEFFKEQMSVLPEIYKDLAWLDLKTELVWLPNTITDVKLGMVYADGDGSGEWNWAAVKAIKLEEPTINKDGSKTEYKPDMSTLKHFKERDYMDALSYIGALPE